MNQSINFLNLIEKKGVPETKQLRTLFINTLSSMRLKTSNSDEQLIKRIDEMINKLKSK